MPLLKDDPFTAVYCLFSSCALKQKLVFVLVSE